MKTEDGVRYESKLRIARVDVSTSPEAVDYYYEQKGWFGRASVIAYQDNGATGSNVFIGGSSDTNHINSGDDEEWAPSITLIDKDGQFERLW